MIKVKNLVQVSVLILCFTLISQGQTFETLSLNEAIQKKYLVVNGKYNPSSVHYLKPVILKLELKGKQAIKIKLEAGDVMLPEDSSCQTMMIMDDMIVTIYPNKQVNIEPYAMCTEPNDRAGFDNLRYTYKRNNNKKLIDIAQFINTNAYDASVAQQAVWCVADNSKSLLDINGYDSMNRKKLIKKVALITGKKVPTDIELVRGYETYVSKPEETIGGMFEFNFSKVKKVHIAMFDSNGIVVRELYYNANEKPGLHKVNFEFDYTLYTNDYYDIKLIADEKVCLVSRVDRKDENWKED